MIEQEFRERVVTLVKWGQLPVMLISCVVLVVVARYYRSPFTGALSGALLMAFLSLGLSLWATTISSRHQGSATALLYLSLLFCVVYVHYLINITGNTYSPFQHVYLYMPAVVVMVTRSRFAEVVCMLAVFASFLVNDYSEKSVWDSWDAFMLTSLGRHFKHLWFVFLLLFLNVVNTRIEKLPAAKHQELR